MWSICGRRESNTDRITDDTDDDKTACEAERRAKSSKVLAQKYLTDFSVPQVPESFV